MLDTAKIVQSLNVTMIANLINFAILVGVLSWLLYEPARDFINERKKKIRSRIENAKEREEDADQLKREREEELKEARSRADEIIENARKTAQKIKSDSRSEAEKEAKRIINEAREEAEREKERVREELKSQYLDVAVMSAERILQREIRAEDHREMIESFIDDLEEDEITIE